MTNGRIGMKIALMLSLRRQTVQTLLFTLPFSLFWQPVSSTVG